MSDVLGLNDYELIQDDHLRLSLQAMHECGEAAQVLAAIWTAAGEGQGRQTFAKIGKLAAVACCSWRTVHRSLEKLEAFDYIKRHGRQPLSQHTDIKRRTITLSLTKNAIKAFVSYRMLPRVLVHVMQEAGFPLSWSERAVLASIVSRHCLIDRIEMEGLGCAEDRRKFSINRLITDTGLTRHSVIAGRDGLERRGIIKVFRWWDGRKHSPVDIHLSDEFFVNTDDFPMPAVKLLQGTPGPRREWQPAPSKGKRRPAQGGSANVTQETSTRAAHAPSENVTQGVVQSCQGGECKSDIGVVQKCQGGSAKVTVAINASSNASSNDSLLRNPLTNHPKQVGVPCGSLSDSGKGEKNQGRGHLDESDLRDTAKLLAWFERRHPDRQCEASQLGMLAAAEVALRQPGTANRPGLFVSIVAKNDGSSLTTKDIDRASNRLKEHNAQRPLRAEKYAAHDPSTVEAELAKLAAALKGGDQ